MGRQGAMRKYSCFNILSTCIHMLSPQLGLTSVVAMCLEVVLQAGNHKRGFVHDAKRAQGRFME